jgi:hypothetical protein
MSTVAIIILMTAEAGAAAVLDRQTKLIPLLKVKDFLVNRRSLCYIIRKG